MTDQLTSIPTTDTATGEITHDLYRGIHKAIRLSLFHTVTAAGAVDTDVAAEVDGLAVATAGVIELLHQHHHHEDVFVQPLIDAHVPDLGADVMAQHAVIEDGAVHLEALAARMVLAGGQSRGALAHDLYLDLSAFTSMYLDHQLLEERKVMPGLCAALPVEALEDVHQRLLQSIAPPDVVTTLTAMLPALAPGERAEVLGGMAAAPPEVFALFWAAAEDALTADQLADVASRIGKA